MKRWIAPALIVGAAALLGGACRDIVSPEPIPLVPRLCTLLEQCEGGDSWDCPNTVSDAFDDLPEDDRPAAYQEFLGADCLADCRNARSCRDKYPLCARNGGGCDEDADCCGFTGGIAECRGSSDGQCCAPDGAPCSTEVGCCEGDCQGGHCGDFACTLVGDPCDSHFECCTKRCDLAAEVPTCIPNTCSIIGEGCELASDCCEPAAVCELGVCSTKQCEGCDPFDPNNCCVVGGEGFCYLLLNEETACGPEDCPPEGVECGGDEDCACATADVRNLVCDDAAFPHCAQCRAAGATCNPALTEAEHGCCGSCDAATSTCSP